MTPFHFYHPVEVRYSDLDPQGHLNNAMYLTYFEQARINYIIQLGLWQGGSFLTMSMIVANAQVNFLAPVLFGQKLKVGVRITRLGNKSMHMEYSLIDTETNQELANGSTVLVAYDYPNEKTAPIPAHWRDVISEFEGLPRNSTE
jgi:acyl-CoA thioester hydrolase